MLGMNWQQKPLKQLLTILLIALLGWTVASCGQLPEGGITAVTKPTRGKLAEVSPPFAIQALKQTLEVYQPQVKILSPRVNQVLEDNQVEVRVQVSDLPLFKDEELELGPYVQILLDNRPYAQVYDTSKPLTLEDLTPGTHTIRAFAVRPWHESFKNEGAFAQTTFHIFTKTPENNPDPNQPLLTYNYPQATYGAEPVLLDFYLTNAPLHLVAREDTQDAIPDWQIRCTINGESFTFDRWEPIYLKGLKPGKNWVQLELLDESGKPLANAFNNTVQIVTYEPGGSDALARLTRGEIPTDAARKIVDPNYVPPLPPEPEAVTEPEPEAITEPEAVTEPEVKPEAVTEPETISEPKTVTESKTVTEPQAEPEAILEPDLTQQPTPEMMPPEVVAPGDEADEIKAPAEATTEPEDTAKFTPTIEPPRFPGLEVPEDSAAQQPVETAPTVDQPVRSENLDAVLQQGSSGNMLQSALERSQESSEVEIRQEPPQGLSNLSESLPQPEPIPAELEMPEPAAEVKLSPIQPVTQLPEPLTSNPPFLAPTSPQLEIAPIASPTEKATQSPTLPSMMGVFDQVKDFFVKLRKQPSQAQNPLAPLLESKEATPKAEIEESAAQLQEAPAPRLLDEILFAPIEPSP